MSVRWAPTLWFRQLLPEKKKSPETSRHWHNEALHLKTRFWTSHWYSMALCHMIGVQRNHCGPIPALPRCPLSLWSIDGVGERPAAADPGRVGHQEWPDTRHHCWAFSFWFYCFNHVQHPLKTRHLSLLKRKSTPIRKWSGCAALSRRRSETCRRGSPKIPLATTSSCTNTPTKATTCSRQVIGSSPVRTRLTGASLDTVCVYVPLISFNCPLTLCSIHLLYARLLVQRQGADAVFQLQKSSGGLGGKGARPSNREKGKSEQDSKLKCSKFQQRWLGWSPNQSW